MVFNVIIPELIILFIAALIEISQATNITALTERSEESQVSEGKQIAGTGFGSIEYTNFIINEYSFKFWAVFQLITLGILLYSVIAAVYYSKWTFLQEVESPDYDADLLFKRSLSDRPLFNPQPLARLLKSLHTLPDFVEKHNEEQSNTLTEEEDFTDTKSALRKFSIFSQ